MMKILGAIVRMFRGGPRGGRGQWRGYLLAAGLAITVFLTIEHWRQKRARAEMRLRQAERVRLRAKTEALADDVAEAEAEVDAAQAQVDEIDHQLTSATVKAKRKLERIRRRALLDPDVADELAENLGI